MTTLFYRNPRLLILAVALVCVSGLSAFHILPRAEDPDLTARGGQVITRFPGASADRVEALITDPLEEELAEIEEIRRIDSTSRNSVSVLTIELRDEVDEVAEIWTRVRDKLDDARPKLPAGVNTEFDEIDITAYSVITALVWDMDRPVQYGILRRLAETLEDRLRSVGGTADVNVFGDPDEEIRLEVHSQRLASLGLTPDELAAIIRSADAKVAAGALFAERTNLLIEVEGELDSLQRIRQLPVRRGAGGRVVRISDIATVRKTTTEPPSELSLIDGRPAIAVAARMQAGQRIDHWAKVLRKALHDFERGLPRGVQLQTVFDQSSYVEQRLDHLLGNLLMGILLVVCVSFFMLGWRGGVVVSLTLPLASLMTLAGMQLMGLPIHQMSITGLIIALGLLIDNAIVMVDAVRGRMRRGSTAVDSIDKTLRELFIPLLGSTLTTVLAFMPVVLSPGGAGEFIGPLGLSVILALVSSFILSVTVVPSLSAYLDRLIPASTESGLLQHGYSNPRLLAWYRSSLDFILERPLRGLAVATVLPVLGFVHFRDLPLQFFPPADRDQFQIQIRLPEQTAMGRTREVIHAATTLIEAHPRVTHVSWFLGRSAPKFYYNMIETDTDVAYYAQALVQLDTIEGAAVINELQDQLDRALPAAQTLCRQLEQGPPFPAPIEIWLHGPDLDHLRELGFEVRDVLAGLPDITHTMSALGDGNPKLWFSLDEERARLVDLDHVAIAGQLDAHLRGVVGGSLLEQTEELPVRLRLVDSQRGDLDQIASIDVLPAVSGAPGVAAGAAAPARRATVPLSSLGHMELLPQRSTIPRRNGQRVNVVQGFLQAGVLPAEVLAQFQRRLAGSAFVLPAGYQLTYGGEANKRKDAVGHLLASAGLLATLMATTLVLSFRSFRLAALIAVVGSLAVGLAFLGLSVAGFPFGFIAIVGTMGLVGVAINDSIVVLAGIRHHDRARRGDAAAIRDVVIGSTRHVLSTTVTTMAGFTPLLLGGGGFWPPLAVVIAGGVSGATLLALYLVPSAYRLLVAERARPAPAETVGDVMPGGAAAAA